jgi:hypothetical protein
MKMKLNINTIYIIEIDRTGKRFCAMVIENDGKRVTFESKSGIQSQWKIEDITFARRVE